MRALVAFVGALLLAVPAPIASAFTDVSTSAWAPGAGAAPPNILVLFLDDVGVDLIGAYGEHPNPANTPVINSLAAGGLLFRNAWSNPSCSPSRSTLLTGRFSFRSGLGLGTGWLSPDTLELDPDTPSIADVVAPTHRTAVVGKWHLASFFDSGYDHALQMGFEHHWGPMANVGGFDDPGYFDYEKNVDGVPQQNSSYATTEQVDDSLTLLSTFDEPWFLYVPFTAPHGPFHAPPPALHSVSLPASVSAADAPFFLHAMLEALDTEIGRLLASIDPAVLANTVVFVIGDNGTAGTGTTPPFDPDHAKNTMYEGGINVPFIVNGPGVPVGDECDGLVNLTDLVATVAELCGTTASQAFDSVSLVPYFSDPDQPSLRPWAYSERFNPNGFEQPYGIWDRTLRKGRYKLTQYRTGSFTPDSEEFFDLQVDPFETNNLLNGSMTSGQGRAYTNLGLTLDSLLAQAYVPWADLGKAKFGSNGVPSLSATGDLTEGSGVSLDLIQAAPNAFAYLCAARGNASVPFLGGTLVPNVVGPGGTVIFAPTNALGQFSTSTIWPPGIPSDTPLYLQHWIVDPGVPFGYSASNAVRGVAF